ncbi:MAG: serine hydrolase [Bacteroidota bacterium]
MNRTGMSILLVLIAIYSLKSQSWEKELDSVMRIIEKDELFQGQILFAEKGRILFNHAYGKDLKGDIITPESPLSIESVTKTFTATAILILNERGLLSLDDKLIRYFPELPYKNVTIRNLLNMTSGLPRFFTTFIDAGDTTKQLSNDDFIKMISYYEPKANKPPGASFFYSDDNYMILASIIQDVTGETFANFLKENIFDPVKMKNTFVKEFNTLNQDQINSTNFMAVYGSGEVYSTAKDLLLFDQALYTNQIITKESIQKMYDPPVLGDGSLSNYGFGWRISNYGNKTEVYAVGDGEHTRASIQRFLDDQKTFIYIHNYSGQEWKPVYHTVKNIWNGEDYEIPSKRVIYDIDPDIYESYIGQYLTKNFGLLHISEENGKLFLRPDPIPGKEELVPSSNTTFYFANQGVEWEFFLNERGEVIGFGIRGRQEMMGPKQ